MTNTAPQNNSISTYNQYKDTGIPWLGQIPAHWEVVRFKFLFKERNERSIMGNEDLLSVSQYTGVTIKKHRITEKELLTNANSLEGYKIVKKKDLVSNIMLAWNGSLGFSKYDGITSPAYSVYKLNEGNDSDFFHYLVRSETYKSEFKRKSSGIIESRLRLYTEDFFNIYSILPPKPEQTAIAHFLDRKTTQIDQAIAQKQALINRLKTYKQVLIQQAVTKGLNPDAPLKDSGVEWIGQIPAHWEVMRLKYLISFHKGKVPSVFYNEEKVNTLPYLSMEYLREENGKTQWVKNNGIKANYGDILLLWDGSNAGEFIKSKEGIVSSTLALLSFNEKYLVNNYTWYLVKIIEKELRKGTVGMGIPHVNGDKLKNLQVFLPPKPEQTAIANFLDRKTTQIDHTIALQEKEIKRLQTYKTVLIDQAVTGKIKVI